MIFKELKERTQELHNEAEKYNDASLVINHTITKEEFIHLLQINYGSYKPIEELLLASQTYLSEELKEFAQPVKSMRLVEDLRELGIQVENQEILEFSYPVSSAMHLIGMMYVIEGSMMGGMVISKHMGKCEALQDLPNQKFFNRNIEAILDRWNRFKEAVEKKEYSEIEIEQAVSAANKTFAFFKEAHIYHKQLS